MMAQPASVAVAATPRVVSLDQFRGWTVLAMAFVNYLGSFKEILPVFKHHHSYFSFADAVMPQFFFAVGFAYRLTFLKNLERLGWSGAVARVIRRFLGLFLIALIVHQLSGSVGTWEELKRLTFSEFLEKACKRSLFQTLTHIAVTSLWVLPVIGLGFGPRLLFAAGSGLLHLWLSFRFNYQWVHTDPTGIDGGPLGFLTWTIPLIFGTFAYDWTVNANSPQKGQSKKDPLIPIVAWGVGLMLLAYGLSCLNLQYSSHPKIHEPGQWAPNEAGRIFLEPPFYPPTEPKNIWTMSQRAGSVTYLLFGAGFSLATYAVFVVLSDRLKWSWSVFGTLGGNALVAYILLGMLEDTFHKYTPKDSPLWFALSTWVIEISLCWAILRSLEKQGVRIRM